MRSYKDIGLYSNPFTIKASYDHNDLKRFPFLVTETQKILKGFLEGIIYSPYEDTPGYYVILGERGSGKTTTLLWLDTIIKELNDKNICSKYERSIRGMGSLHNLAMKLLPSVRTTYIEDAKFRLESFLQGKKYFWFIDVPDRTTPKELDMLTEGLEILLGFKNISIFIAMNKSHYNKTFEFSEIMGKFTQVTLKPFSFQETKKLIEERIKRFQIEKDKQIELFTNEAIEKIHTISKGIPRNILSVCDFLLSSFLQTDEKIIDIDFVENIAGEDIAKKIINERIENNAKREALLKLYSFLKEKKIIENQEKLISEISEKFGICRITVIKRLRELEKLGLIEIEKSIKDSWTNIIRVVV